VVRAATAATSGVARTELRAVLEMAHEGRCTESVAWQRNRCAGGAMGAGAVFCERRAGAEARGERGACKRVCAARTRKRILGVTESIDIVARGGAAKVVSG